MTKELTMIGLKSTRKNRKSRVAWLAGGSLFSVALLGFGAVQTVGLLAHRRYRTHTVITTPVRLVDISSSGGTVTVQGTSDANVTIDASISEGLSSPSSHTSVQEDRLMLRSSWPPVFNTFCNINYTVRMPEGLPLKVRSSGGGIHVDHVDGNLDLSSSGGGVHVTGGRGLMRLHSSGGGISAISTLSSTVAARSSGGSVRLSFQQPPSDVKVSSSGGGITVVLPNTPDAYRVDISSSGGSADNNVRTDSASARLVRAHSSGGGVHITYPTTP